MSDYFDHSFFLDNTIWNHKINGLIVSPSFSRSFILLLRLFSRPLLPSFAIAKQKDKDASIENIDWNKGATAVRFLSSPWTRPPFPICHIPITDLDPLVLHLTFNLPPLSQLTLNPFSNPASLPGILPTFTSSFNSAWGQRFGIHLSGD